MSRAHVAVLIPAVLVAVAAIAATAHGVFEVAVAAHVPPGIAWLYPLITDGLALVAYAATHRLSPAGSVYAWAVVAIAAGLSGVAQAAYLASGPALDTSPGLRFGVGAWPAVAAAIVAHLVYLLATHMSGDVEASTTTDGEVENGTPRTVADRVAELEDQQVTTGGDEPTTPPVMVNGHQPAPKTRTALRLAPAPPATPAEGVQAVDPRAAALISAGAGRKRLAKELAITEHQARQLLDQVRA